MFEEEAVGTTLYTVGKVNMIDEAKLHSPMH